MSVLVLCVCVFCDSFLCSISLFLLSDSLSCVLNSVVYTVCHCSCIRTCMSSFSPCSPAPSSTSYTKVQRIHYQLLSANGINSLHMKCMFTYLCNLIIVHEVQAYPHTVRYNTCAVEHIQLHYIMPKIDITLSLTFLDYSVVPHLLLTLSSLLQ